jgi:hypothetical protein
LVETAVTSELLAVLTRPPKDVGMHSVVNELTDFVTLAQLVKALDVRTLHLACLRGRLGEPREPRAQEPGEPGVNYRTYLMDFRKHVLKDEKRPEVEAAAERLRVELLEARVKVSVCIAETFAVHRVGGPEPCCFVNLKPKLDFYSADDYEPGRIMGYDVETGLTRVEAYADPGRFIEVALPDFRVRFSPEYGRVDQVEDQLFKEQSRHMGSMYRWKQVRRELRAKYKGLNRRKETDGEGGQKKKKKRNLGASSETAAGEGRDKKKRSLGAEPEIAAGEGPAKRSGK